jgi:hypothetical protein
MVVALNTLDSCDDGCFGGAVDDDAATRLQSLHFTAAVVGTGAGDDDEEDGETAVALNALMRRGLYGILASADPIASLATFGCSPSLARVLLGQYPIVPPVMGSRKYRNIY